MSRDWLSYHASPLKPQTTPLMDDAERERARPEDAKWWHNAKWWHATCEFEINGGSVDVCIPGIQHLQNNVEMPNTINTFESDRHS